MNKQWSILIFLLFAMFFQAPDAQAKAEKFVIEKYHVRVIVTKENTYCVQEEITVNFSEEQHGIYRDIPLKNKANRTEKIRVSKIATIESASCGGSPYESSKRGNYYRLKIGNPNKTVVGERDYFISYDYALGNDILKGADEFNFNIIGTNWKTTIQNVTFEIHFPKDFSYKNIELYYGKYGAKNTEGISYQVVDNSIWGELDSSITLQKKEGVSLRVLLPEGYFNQTKETKWPMYIALGIGVCTAIIAFFLWWKIGKDDKVVETVEFYPPNNMNSLEVAFAYNGSVTSKDVVSLVAYLASKGYLEIGEGESEDDFTLTKLKNYDGKNQYERMFMEGLFKHQKTVRKSMLVNSFYKTVEDISDKINHIDNKKRYFFANSLNKGLTLWIMVFIMFFFAVLPPVVVYEEEFIPGILRAFGAGFVAIIGFSLLLESRTTKDKIITGLVFVVIAMLQYRFYLEGALLTGGWDYPLFYVLIYLLTGIIIFFDTYMSKRNAEGLKILGRVKGFKTFLETAEKERLEAMVKENPNYYYDILPYAYVLNVSDKWMKKFETMSMEEPKWYRGHSTFHIATFNHFMNSTMSSANTAMTSAPSSGGGGFVGGGFGGGGGGSW